MAARRKTWKEQGKCVKCGGERDSERVKCGSCRELAKKTYERAKKRCKDRNLCLDCGKWFCLDGNARCKICYLKRVAHKRLGSTSKWKEIDGLFEQQSGLCPYTGIPLQLGLNAELDHKVPKSKGGTDDVLNLQWVYSKVNTMKWNNDEGDFLSLVKLVYEHKCCQ